MTTAVAFTVINAVFLAVFAVLGALNIASAGRMFDSDSDPRLTKVLEFARHGLIGAGNAVAGLCTIGGVIWILVLQ